MSLGVARGRARAGAVSARANTGPEGSSAVPGVTAGEAADGAVAWHTGVVALTALAAHGLVGPVDGPHDPAAALSAAGSHGADQVLSRPAATDGSS